MQTSGTAPAFSSGLKQEIETPTPKVAMPKAPPTPKMAAPKGSSFRRGGQAARAAASSHPHKNLGKFLHPKKGRR